MKPVALWAEMIGNSTTPDQVVLDPFLGSGTTVVACERLGRRGFGIELDPRYVDVAVSRWELLFEGKALSGCLCLSLLYYQGNPAADTLLSLAGSALVVDGPEDESRVV